MFKRAVCLVAFAIAACTAVAVGAEEQRRLRAPIINGVTLPGGAASIAQILGPTTTCTGTLIGCRTVLTAAHCVCPSGVCATPPFVFFQHLGPVAVQSAVVHPDYQPLTQFSPAIHDLAVLRLAAPAENLPIAGVNAGGRVPHGSTVGLLGFGRTEDGPGASGILRAGEAVTTQCDQHGNLNLCTRFDAPVGAPGADSNTCQGDSGGPIVAAGVVSGVVSGGNATCLPPDHTWSADVFVDRAWIAGAAAGDLGSQCPSPRVGEVGVSVGTAEDHIGAGAVHGYDFEVPPGTGKLRVTLMAEAAADVDLTVSKGAASCSSDFATLPEVCVFDAPAAGPWQLQVTGFAGAGLYQLVATSVAAPAVTGCTPGASTLCIDATPGDRRFRVEVSYSTAQGGGASGQALAVPLSPVGATAGGLFTFFDPANPELMLKILNACVPPFNSFWIFYAATTNVGFDVRVTDTVTGNVWQRTNPDRTPAVPVQDTSALPCS